MKEIEKNIPLPPPRDQRKKYPYESMDIGDSFFVHREEANYIHIRSQANGHWKWKTGFKFATRIMDDGIRVWRIE